MRSSVPEPAGQAGSLSLESVLVLPVLAFVVVGLVQVATLMTDLLLLHEAARSGARAAATTDGSAPVVDAARQAAPELVLMKVEVTPARRSEGDIVVVETSLVRKFGPVGHLLRARASSRVEPVVGASGSWP